MQAGPCLYDSLSDPEFGRGSKRDRSQSSRVRNPLSPGIRVELEASSSLKAEVRRQGVGYLLALSLPRLAHLEGMEARDGMGPARTSTLERV